MAPEQLRGELLDARADLYALGCILYELLAGQPPYPAASAAELYPVSAAAAGQARGSVGEARRRASRA
jgi:serine/threonine protein kinase